MEKKKRIGNWRARLFKNLQEFENAQLVMPGVIALQAKRFSNYETAAGEIKLLSEQLLISNEQLKGITMIVICDDSSFVSEKLNNFYGLYLPVAIRRMTYMVLIVL